MKLIRAPLAAMAILVCGSSTMAAENVQRAAGKLYSPPRTPEGKPDLQGIWANNNATPLERPKSLEGRAILTKEEVAALRKRQDEIFAGDGDAAFGDAIFEAVISDVHKYKPTTFDVSTGNYNAFWLVGRDFDNRTSLITDPEDGRMPPMTEAGQQRLARSVMSRNASDGPESRTLSERCITFGVPDLLAGYNSYYQIVQTKDTVILHAEKIHDARVIPLDGRPHSPTAIQSWFGDSRGHWEGDTLVVDTINLKNSFRGASDQLHLIERFTRVDPNTIHYEVTIDDPATWKNKWTLMIPLRHTDDHIYEYACHEGNSGLAGILSGARAEERLAAQQNK
ncbi:MAG TPA: hypothetical protein VET48_08300 [Steroidobacteraceae bacterium]|nr:hypothetical protein [Steroidobacteraceae bacterium]